MSIITEGDLRLMVQVALTSLTSVKERVTALEARCHELEHDGAKGVQEQIADLQERVRVLENEHSGDAPSEVRYAPVDSPWVKRQFVMDHRDADRPVKAQPAQMMVCEREKYCTPDRLPDCTHRGKHPYVPACDGMSASCGNARCIPVPASPDVAIPDVPTPVGTEVFREALGSQARDLSDRYRWAANAGLTITMRRHGIDYLERLAGVACTLRDAYDLARTGEQEQADEKLREIEW